MAKEKGVFGQSVAEKIWLKREFVTAAEGGGSESCQGWILQRKVQIISKSLRSMGNDHVGRDQKQAVDQ